MKKMDNPNKCGCVSSYGGLLATAKRAYARAARENTTMTGRQDNALTAALLSCATLEGYINESFALIREGPGMKICPERAKSFANILHEIESSRGSIRLKYLMAHTVLTGHPFAKGEYPFQDFELLFSIRNELMHHKLEKITEHRLVERLRAKHLCSNGGGKNNSWREIVFTPATAKWAVNTAVEMINTIQTALFSCASEGSEVTPLTSWSAIKQTKLK